MSKEEIAQKAADTERAKKIMSVPVNIRKTQAYWMLLNSNKQKAKELGLR
jgi:hypothetical protein